MEYTDSAMMGAMKRANKVGIVGGGAIGSAIGQTMHEVGVSVVYWDIDPSKATIGSLPELLEYAPVIFLAIPSKADRAVLGTIADHLTGSARPLVISVSKGVEPGFVTIDKVLAEGSKDKFDYGLLYGPMLAKEISEGKHGHGVLATNTDRWHGLFAIPDIRLRTTYSTDLHSVALSGPLKNIYSLGLGLSDGLSLGFNTKGMLTLEAANEMKRLVAELGGDPVVVEGLAGLADLVATGWSGSSFNYQAAYGLAAGKHTHEGTKGEGVGALREISSVVDISSYPLLHVLHQIFIEQKNPDQFVRLLKQKSLLR